MNGELRIEIETDTPEDRFVPGREVLLGRDVRNMRRAVIETVRPHKSWLLVKFDIASARESAQLLTGSRVFIPASEARDLDEDEFFVHELIGLEVFTDAGERVGEVKSFIETGTADVLVIGGTERDQLVPLTGEVVESIDVETGRMVIHPLPGLLD